MQNTGFHVQYNRSLCSISLYILQYILHMKMTQNKFLIQLDVVGLVCFTVVTTLS